MRLQRNKMQEFKPFINLLSTLVEDIVYLSIACVQAPVGRPEKELASSEVGWGREGGLV